MTQKKDVKQAVIFGYARVSRPGQSIDRQIRNIKANYPDALIYSESGTGTTMNRPNWNKLVNRVNAGDTIVFDSVSRLSRTAREGFEVYQELFTRGVRLVFLKEPHIDTDVYNNALKNQISLTGTKTDIILRAVNDFLLQLACEQIQIAFNQAEKEVSDLHQRTREGIETARIAGKQIGQKTGSTMIVKKKAPAMDIIRTHAKSFGGTLSDTECMLLAGISRNTFYKYKAELRNEKNMKD